MYPCLEKQQRAPFSLVLPSPSLPPGLCERAGTPKPWHTRCGPAHVRRSEVAGCAELRREAPSFDATRFQRHGLQGNVQRSHVNGDALGEQKDPPLYFPGLFH